MNVTIYFLAVAMLSLHGDVNTAFYEDAGSRHEFEHYYAVADACVHNSWGALSAKRCVAMAYHESRWNPEHKGRLLKSGAQAQGMMQVIPHFIRRIASFKQNIYTVNGSVFYGALAYNQFAAYYGDAKALCHYGGGNHCARVYERVVLRYLEDLERRLYKLSFEISTCEEHHGTEVASVAPKQRHAHRD